MGMLDTPPPRRPDCAAGDMKGEAAFTVSLTCLAALLPFSVSVGMLIAGGIAAVLLAAVALARRMVAASSIGVLVASFLLFKSIGLGPKRVVFGFAFVAYLVARSRLPWLRDLAPWHRAGSRSVRQCTIGVAFGLVSGLVLWAWCERKPEKLSEVIEYVQDWPVWTLVVVGVVSASVAAVLEEGVYRGVFQDSLERAIGSGGTALVLQAAVFAALHFPSGILKGPAGVLLAFPYGLVLGTLRRRSGGLAVPVAAHFSTDLVIVGIVLVRTVA